MSILIKREDGGRSHRRTIRSGEVEDESNFGHTEFEVHAIQSREIKWESGA